MTADARKLPPFAKQISPGDALVMIYCGRRGWELAPPGEGRVGSLVFPNNRDPSEFTWPVHSKQVLVMALDSPPDAVDLLTVELLRAGAAVVWVKHRGDDGALTRYALDSRRNYVS